MNSKKTLLTEQFGNLVASDVKLLFASIANTYLCIGRSTNFGDSEANVEDAIYTTVYRNQVYRDLVAVKKIHAEDMQLVVPRVDWATGGRRRPGLQVSLFSWLPGDRVPR